MSTYVIFPCYSSVCGHISHKELQMNPKNIIFGPQKHLNKMTGKGWVSPECESEWSTWFLLLVTQKCTNPFQETPLDPVTLNQLQYLNSRVLKAKQCNPKKCVFSKCIILANDIHWKIIERFLSGFSRATSYVRATYAI